MNLQETSIRQSALGWVKKSIDDNLGEIEIDLKRYIEDGDTDLLEAVKQRLGIVQGVLMMIEQYGAAMLTEEMVALADFVAEQEANEPALEVLLRAVLQLPDYLEHIQSGHRDIPIAILPLLNDIRAVRNQDLFSEKLLFLPDLSMHQDGAEVESLDAQQNQASKLLAKKLRPIYQLALLNVIQEKSVDESLQRLEKVCETLEERSFSEQIARIWWIVGALIESVSRGQLELGVSIKNLLGKVDALFRVILIIGEGGLLKRQPIELIKNFLYYIAQPECDGPKTQAIKTAYRLEQFLPSESARSKVLDNIAGPNQALLKTVAEAMKADIEAVKSTFEVYVNGDLGKVELLKELPQEMHIISDTLAMIGLGMQRQLVETQIETVRRIVAGDIEASEEQLLSMAAELLQVEQALDQMQKRQPVEPPKTEIDISRDYEMDNVLSAVVTAALDDIQKTKNAILEFIKDPSKNENIELCVTLMEESRGALELMNQPRAVAVVDGLLAYLKGYDIVEFMEASRLDALSQVVVSLEYYLEALGEHREDVDSILDLADEQLQELLVQVTLDETDSEPEPLFLVDEETARAGAATTEAEPLEPRLEVVAGGESREQEEVETAPDGTFVAAEIDTLDALPAGEVDLRDESETVAEVPGKPEITEALEEAEVHELDDVLEVPEVAEAPETPGVPDSAEIPEVAEAPEVVEVPGVAEVSEVPEAPEVPDVAEIPEVAEAPEVDGVPGVAEVSEAPETPEVPDVAEVPEVAEAPGMVEVAEVFEVPEAPEVPDVAEIPEVAEEPEVVGVPEVAEAPEPEPVPAEAMVEVVEVHSALDQVARSGVAESQAAAEPEPPTVEPESKPAVAKVEVEPVEEELEVLKPGSDPDILEIYLEEAEDESRNIARLQQDWLLHPEDENALKNIRRAFHTIKGSGRLVGAMKIGEFAWDYEQLLNRVIDKTIASNDHIIGAVGKAARALPELVEELKAGTPPRADIGYLRGLARALAEFNAEQVLFEHTQSMTAIESPYDRITGQGEDAFLEPDTAEWQGQIEPAGTRMAPPELRERTLLEDIEPDTMKVDPAELTLPENSYTRRDRSGFDQTLLAQPADVEDTESANPERKTPQAPSPGETENRDDADDDRAVDYPGMLSENVADVADVVDEIELDDDDTLLAQPADITITDSTGIDLEALDVPWTDESGKRDDVDDNRAIDYPGMRSENVAGMTDVVDEIEQDDDDTLLAQSAEVTTADSTGIERQIPAEPSVDETDDRDQADHLQPTDYGYAPDQQEDEGADMMDVFDLDDDDTLLAQSSGFAPAEPVGIEGGPAAAPEADESAEYDTPQATDDVTPTAEYGDDAAAFGDAFELDGDDSAPREAIEIETIGEDFIGDEFDDDLDAEFSLDSAEATAMRAEVSGQTNFESADTSVMDDSAMEPLPELMAEADSVETPEAEEITLEAPEAEEISPEAPEAEELSFDAPSTEAQSFAAPATEESTGEAPPLAQPQMPDAGEVARNEPAPSGEDGSATMPEEPPPDPFVDTTRTVADGNEAGEVEPPLGAPDAPTDLSFDPELLIIYQQEVEQHLSTVNSVLDRAEQIQELVPGEKIYRALHTIHGASRTADISTIGELAGLLEKPLKSALSQNMALDHEIVALYREGQRALQDMTRELVETRRLPRIPHDLEISLRALAEDLEEHTVEIPEDEAEPTGEFIDTLTMMSETGEVGQDDELLTIFVDEATELLEMSDNTLHNWSQQESDDAVNQDFSAVMELQRYLHTLKGGARMAELKEISDLAHEMESIFIAVIDGRVEKDDNLIEVLRDCFDLLNTQVSEAQEGRALSDCSAQVARLAELRRGDGDVETEGLLEAGLDADSEDIDIVAENLSSEPLVGQERPSQDVIKVRSDLLDNLVNAAGEVSIYRARMEQQVAGLGSHLGELGQTIARLKGQLRNLEAETDAQIHYSHRAEARRDGEFDPLEMDRYTMIQELSRSLSESVNDLSSLQNMLGEQVKDSETLLLQQSRVNTDLQDGLIKSRMVRFSGLLSRLRRLVRQSSQELGKKAELLVSGEENEVDNKVLDRMVAPLEHIIRNALSHGIETAVERVKKGKPETGRINIDITRDGSDVVIRVSDDGAGVNIEKVRSRAIQLGLLDETRQVSEADLVQYILEPGFSTAEHVTQLSGRGVGMDVVDIEIKQLGGTLQIETDPQGTSFVARLPFTLSINQAILVRTGDEIYAIPLLNIEGITRLDSQQLAELYRQENPELEYAGQQFALHALSRLVDGSVHFRASADDEKQAIIFSRAGDVRVALHVDEILGNREIVVKTLGKQLSQVKGLAGASILADGSVVLILDINGLARQNVTSSIKILYKGDEQRQARSRDTVMVVDDSITMRRVASKLLERHNYEVVTAKDGVDALAQLEDVRPDVMLLDIEMPRMDGFELATHMRNEESYSGIPIIMITSRTGEKHRDRAFEIGITNYMGKPYQEEELIENIQNALRVG